LANSISIVMATYNGERYISQQLESIKEQTIQADEVIICDDGSSDDTVKMVERFIRDNELITWKIIKNKKNKGWQKNFMDAISYATGEIVFLADQDDIWHTKKIEVMSNIMYENRKINLLMCEYKKFSDEEIEKNGDITLEYYKRDSKPWNNGILYPGCTYCFRKKFFDDIKGAWTNKMPHDALIYQAAWLSDSGYICKAVLHFFRRHGDSVTTLSKPDFSKDNRIERLERRNHVYEFLMMKTSGYDWIKDAENYRKWLCLRIQLLKNRKLINILRLLKYRKYYSSLKTWGMDCVVALR